MIKLHEKQRSLASGIWSLALTEGHVERIFSCFKYHSPGAQGFSPNLGHHPLLTHPLGGQSEEPAPHRNCRWSTVHRAQRAASAEHRGGLTLPGFGGLGGLGGPGFAGRHEAARWHPEGVGTEGSVK